MRFNAVRVFANIGLALGILLISQQPYGFAQDDGGGGDGGGGDDNSIVAAGVAVDASGVLRSLTTTDVDGSLARQRAAQALATLDADVAKVSALRKVSLTRLARLTKQAIENGFGPDETMKHLAGLTRIQYVFYYPETQDIVIAGPAEGWMADVDGRKVGIETGKPIVELEELVVALRAFPPHEKSNPIVYCSIDATQEGLERMNQFLSSIGNTFTGSIDDQFIVSGLQEALGLQTVTVGGIPATTRFARIMVEADYRMKLIGIGLEQPAARIKSYVSMANFATIARNAMCRWWFVPDYNRVQVTEDGLGAELVGNGVKLIGEDEVVAADGSRRQAGRQNRASQRFTKNFTDQYGNLAERDPVYAQLRNCVDLLVVAALIQKNDYYSLAGWDLSVLGDESTYPVENYNAPQRVETAVNSIWKGAHLATPVGGGVQIQAAKVLEAENLIPDEKETVKTAREGIKLSDLPADTWWWD